MTQGLFSRGLMAVAGMATLSLCASAEPDVIPSIAEAMGGVPASAKAELKSAKSVGWSNYVAFVYNRVNDDFESGLTTVDPADLWTNYTCVALADTLAQLGVRDTGNIDIVMRTHLVSGNVFIIDEGTMKRDPHTFTADEMYAVISLMTDRFMEASNTDKALVSELKTSFDGCAGSLRAETRPITK